MTAVVPGEIVRVTTSDPAPMAAGDEGSRYRAGRVLADRSTITRTWSSAGRCHAGPAAATASSSPPRPTSRYVSPGTAGRLTNAAAAAAARTIRAITHAAGEARVN